MGVGTRKQCEIAQESLDNQMKNKQNRQSHTTKQTTTNSCVYYQF